MPVIKKTIKENWEGFLKDIRLNESNMSPEQIYFIKSSYYSAFAKCMSLFTNSSTIYEMSMTDFSNMMQKLKEEIIHFADVELPSLFKEALKNQSTANEPMHNNYTL